MIEFDSDDAHKVRIRLMGDVTRTYRIPEPYAGGQFLLNVGDHAFAAAIIAGAAATILAAGAFGILVATWTFARCLEALQCGGGLAL